MRYVVKELLRHRWRTIFSITGYAVASVFILVLLCITGSNKKDSFGILQNTGTHFIVYIPSTTACCTSSTANSGVIAEGVRTMMMDSSIIRSIENVEGVKDAAPCLLFRMHDEGFKGDITLSGIDTTSIATASSSCSRTNLVSGKFLSANPSELVAEQSFAAAHSLSVGDTLHVFGGKMTIAGIVNSGIKPVKADFYAPITFVRSILKDNLRCNSPYFDMNIVLVEVEDARMQNDVMAKIKNMMYKFAVSSYNCYEPASKAMSVIGKSSLGITVMIFVFLVIFSAKTQLTALMERFREIGILKSLGWSDLRLGMNVIGISLIQALTGVTTGILIGIAVIVILRNNGSTIFGAAGFAFSYAGIPLLYILALAGALIAAVFPLVKIYYTRPGDIIKNNM